VIVLNCSLINTFQEVGEARIPPIAKAVETDDKGSLAPEDYYEAKSELAKRTSLTFAVFAIDAADGPYPISF
jgi:hypothetical protein